MRYLPAGDDALLRWLRAELPTAVALFAVCTDVDEPGIALLAAEIRDLVARGGSVCLVVPAGPAGEAATAADLVSAAGPSAVVLAGTPPVVNALVLTYPDGGQKAYQGGTAWLATQLRHGQPGVLFDQRRDAAAITRLLTDMNAVRHSAATSPSLGRLLEDLLQECMDSLQLRSGSTDLETGAVHPGKRGTPTGLADLDALTGGIWPGDLWVLTGRTGAGKSALALNVARSAAISHDTPVGLITAQENAVDVTTRVLSAEARVPLHHLRMGAMTDEDWARLARRMGEVANAPLVVIETAVGEGSATAFAQTAAVTTSDRRELKLVILDDLASADVLEDLRVLKAVAVREHIAALVVVPDSAGGRGRERDACRLADLVLRIDRGHDLKPGHTPSPRVGEADLIVLRHRRGPLALLTVVFQGHYARFVDTRTDH